MSEHLPAGHELMSAKSLRAQQDRMRHRRSPAELPRIGHGELGPHDGLVEPTAWDGVVEGRKWLVDDRIPLAQVTTINGNGGEGKSLLAAQLCAAAATGGSWIGHRVKNVRSMMVHCEDDEIEMRRRLNGILEPQGYSHHDLDDLTLVDRDGAESNLFYEADPREPQGRFTEFYMRVCETVYKRGIQLLVLDTLSNFFGGNENIRSQVEQFVGGLKRLAKNADCAIVLLAHPSRAGMGQGGDGTSGSTHWHNAVRSRFWLHRPKLKNGEKGPLILEHMKANYGRLQDPVEIAWEAGRFVPVVQPDRPTLWRAWEDEDD